LHPSQPFRTEQTVHAQPFFSSNRLQRLNQEPTAQKKRADTFLHLHNASPHVPRLFQTQPADAVNAKQEKQPKTSLPLQHFFNCCSTTAKNRWSIVILILEELFCDAPRLTKKTNIKQLKITKNKKRKNF